MIAEIEDSTGGSRWRSSALTTEKKEHGKGHGKEPHRRPLAGGLAGAYYGCIDIAQRWLEVMNQKVLQLADTLLEMQEVPVSDELKELISKADKGDTEAQRELMQRGDTASEAGDHQQAAYLYKMAAMAYASREFSDSGVMMSRSIRTNKSASVSASVRSSSSYVSDQGGVWRDIEALHQSHGTSSHTGAMKDAYESRKAQTESYKGHFPCQDGQCGMAVLIKGRVAGVEFLSRPEAYRQLHEKLLGSYIMDIPMAQPGKSGPDPLKVQKILDRIKDGTEERFKSVGLGEDCRYTIRGMVGSALLVDNWYLHGAFFRSNTRSQADQHQTERMASLSRRRGYRQE